MKFFGELIAEAPFSALGQVQVVLGEKLLEADCERVSMDATRYLADRDRWQQFGFMNAFGLLIGAVIGCVMLFWAVGR